MPTLLSFHSTSIIPQLRNSKGLTLVELVISMLILSVIGATGGVAFVHAMRVHRQVRERSLAFEKMHTAADMVRRIASNLGPAKVVGMDPYAEVSDPDTGAKVYQCIVRVPERLSGEKALKTLGEVMRLWVVSEGELQSLHLSRQYLGTEGLLGQAEECILAENLRGFTLEPVYETEKQEKDGQQDAQGGEGEDTEVLASLKVWIDVNLSDEKGVSTSLVIPVRNRPPKK
ncbi:TPA: hypothetical protein DDW35_01215 [Candidatus Sumerlaeota bacterium]|nr:hypothetical protein [Candidatus Sumerlaeota bacterium]